jgi:hypothetical protein
MGEDAQVGCPDGNGMKINAPGFSFEAGKGLLSDFRFQNWLRTLVWIGVACYCVTTVIPSHLNSIKAGYKEINDSNNHTIEVITSKHVDAVDRASKAFTDEQIRAREDRKELMDLIRKVGNRDDNVDGRIVTKANP